MTNVQGDNASAKDRKYRKKNQEVIHEEYCQTIHLLVDTVGISHGLYYKIMQATSRSYTKS
jgi:hypothetical protein